LFSVKCFFNRKQSEIKLSLVENKTTKMFSSKKNKGTTIFGIRPITEAIRSGKDIEKIFFQQGTPRTRGRLMCELNDEIKKFKIPFQFVPAQKLNHIVKSRNHQGVVALISPVSYSSIEDIIPAIFEKGETPLVIILDRITDVRNFGAICRSAECAGAHAIIIPSHGNAQINSDAIKTSAGAIFNIPICRSENLKQTIDFLKKSGLSIIACMEKSERTIYETNFSLPTALLFGSEENGISQEYLKLSDVQAKIPLFGKIQSLNVSVSAGIVLYEAVRQRMK
jgi:23S rRNA (guanosine2251-2'-O)-methyltransferase